MLTMIANAVTLHAVTVLDVTIIVRLAYSTQPDGFVTPSVYEMRRGGALTNVVTTLRVEGKGQVTLYVGHARVLDVVGHFQAVEVAAISVNDVAVFAVASLLIPAVSVFHAVRVVTTCR